MEKYGIFFFLAFIAEIIGTLTGFGSSILFVPIASLFFDFTSVLGITAAFHVFSNLAKLSLFREGFDKKIAIRLGIPAVASVILGATLTTFIPKQQIELMMNLMLIALAIYLMLHANKTLKKTNQNLILGGLSSGFLAGMIGTGGAIRGLVLSAFGLEKMLFISTSALIDLGVDFSRAVIYIWNGYFKTEFLVFIPVLIAISFLGSWVGKLLVHRISQTIFQYLVFGTIILTSLFQLGKYFFK